MSVAAGTAGELGGRVAGGALGGVIGGVFGGPVGAWIGRAVGSRVGGMAGRAAAAAISDYMEDSNEAAEEETKDEAADVPCEDCGEIDCFNPPKDPEKYDEFKRQLKEQEGKINDTDASDLLSNMRNGRPKNDPQKRRQAREDYRQERTDDLIDLYESQGVDDPTGQAAADVAREMANLDATHALDFIGGGDGTISGLGDSSVNRSLGAQWRGKRSQQLKQHAEKAKEQGKKMNVELEECPDDSEVGTSAGSSDNSPAAPAPGSSGSGPIS